MDGDTASMPVTTVPDGTGPVAAAVQWTWHNRPVNLFRSSERRGGLEALAGSNGVTAVLPFRHKPLNHPDHPEVAWSATVLALCPSIDHARALARAGAPSWSSPNGPVAVDVLKGQPGLDMLYPKVQGRRRERRLLQWIEYVFANPERRDTYYQQQYAFSGPAMRRLHDRDCVGRFIGFEHVDRVEGNDAIPLWDVLHVFAFTPLQVVKSIPGFRRAWQDQAVAAYGPGTSSKAIMRSWGAMRIRLVARARQQMDLTRQTSDRH